MSLPGRAFASAMNSFSVLTCSVADTMSTVGVNDTSVIAVKSFIGSYGGVA